MTEKQKPVYPITTKIPYTGRREQRNKSPDMKALKKLKPGSSFLIQNEKKVRTFRTLIANINGFCDDVLFSLKRDDKGQPRVWRVL